MKISDFAKNKLKENLKSNPKVLGYILNMKDLEKQSDVEIFHFCKMFNLYKREYSHLKLNFQNYKTFKELFKALTTITKIDANFSNITSEDIPLYLYFNNIEYEEKEEYILMYPKSQEELKLIGSKKWCTLRSKNLYKEYLKFGQYIVVYNKDNDEIIGLNLNKEKNSYKSFNANDKRIYLNDRLKKALKISSKISQKKKDDKAEYLTASIMFTLFGFVAPVLYFAIVATITTIIYVFAKSKNIKKRKRIIKEGIYFVLIATGFSLLSNIAFVQINNGKYYKGLSKETLYIFSIDKKEYEIPNPFVFKKEDKIAKEKIQSLILNKNIDEFKDYFKDKYYKFKEDDFVFAMKKEKHEIAIFIYESVNWYEKNSLRYNLLIDDNSKFLRKINEQKDIVSYTQFNYNINKKLNNRLNDYVEEFGLQIINVSSSNIEYIIKNHYDLFLKTLENNKDFNYKYLRKEESFFFKIVYEIIKNEKKLSNHLVKEIENKRVSSRLQFEQATRGILNNVVSKEYKEYFKNKIK